MIDVARFVREAPGLWDDFPRSTHPKDRSLAPVFEQVEGMATENKLKLLNFACSLLSPDDLYLEVGTWKGATLVGALHGNACRGIAVDNFSQFEGTRAILEANVAKFGLTRAVDIIEGDSFEVARRRRLALGSIDVYFYDGDHTYGAQYKALHLFEPFLKDIALVLVDDTLMGQVYRANKDFALLNRSQWSLLFDIKSREQAEPLWWNGVQVFQFLRRPAKSHSLRELKRLANQVVCTCGAVYCDLWLPRYASARARLHRLRQESPR